MDLVCGLTGAAAGGCRQGNTRQGLSVCLPKDATPRLLVMLTLQLRTGRRSSVKLNYSRIDH